MERTAPAQPIRDKILHGMQLNALGGVSFHYKLIGGDHGLRVSGSTVYAGEAKGIIAAFLLQ